jgi:excisionase family DNA binding protein
VSLAAPAEAPAQERLLRVSEAAKRLDCSPEWVRMLGRRGDLVIHKLGTRSHRVTESSLLAFLARTRA